MFFPRKQRMKKSFNQTVLSKILDSAVNRHVSSFEFDTFVICHVFVRFRLISIARYVFKSPSICFRGTNRDKITRKFTVNMLLTGILSYDPDAGPGCLIRTVCKYSMLIQVITDIIFVIVCFSSKAPQFNFEKAIRMSKDVLIRFLHLSGRAYVAQCFGYSSFCSF